MNEQPESRDDADWLDTLAGRPPADADPAIRREAEALRQAILDRQGYTREELEHGRRRLLFHARQEGLLKSRDRSRWRNPPLLSGLAAGLAAAVVLVPLLYQPWEAPPPMTGPPTSFTPKAFVVPQSVQVQSPELRARGLAGELKDLGLTVTVAEQEGRWYVDAAVPEPPPPGLIGILEGRGLAMPQENRLLVEFYR